MDPHAERRERRRQKLSRGGRAMVVQGRGYVRVNLAAIEQGALGNGKDQGPARRARGRRHRA